MNNKSFLITALLVFLVCLLGGAARGGVISTSYQVSAGADDGYAWSAAGQDISSGYLVIGDEDYSAPYHISAMRFAGLDIPRSAVILEAHLRIRSIDEERGGQIYGVIEAEAADDAEDFSSRYIGSAVKTAAAVVWDHTKAWDKNTWYTSDDISSVIAEVVDRGGWSKGNSLAILYSTRADSDKNRMFSSFELGAAYGAVLEITYETYTISGYVLDGEGEGLSGVNVSAGSDIEGAVTDGDGYYELEVPAGWSGVVTPSKADWGFSPASRSYSSVTSDLTGQDYTGFQPEISGYIRDSQELGIEGALVTADNGGGSDTTGPDGYYEVIVPYDWSGVVTPSKADWGFSPASRSYSSVTSDRLNQNYTAFQPKISGYIRDGQGVGIEGALVTADNGGGSDTTGPDGYYEVTVVYGWSGIVTPSKVNWGFSPVNRSYSNLTSNATGQDYSGFQPKISGYILDDEGVSVEGILVTADNGGGSDSTDLGGYYEVVVPYGWSGIVVPSMYDWKFIPESRTYSNVTSDQTNQDYTVLCRSWFGNGDINDPYQIWTAEEMQAIGVDANYWGAHFLLMADIDLSAYTGTSFNIIGNNVNAFTGVYDGNGHTISNFTYDSNGVDYIGLFGYTQGAELKDLGLVSPNVSGGDGNNVGGLVGYLLYGSVSECYVEGGSVTGINYVGGLAGYAFGSISSCYSTGMVFGEAYVGGLTGRNGYKVTNSYSMCNVTGVDRVGGLTGSNSGRIYYCYSTGSVLGTADVGGLAGYSTIAAVGSFWDIETSGIDYSSTGTGLTTAQMQSLSTFAASGWGCDEAWTIDDGNDYPRLVWEGSGGELITGQLADFISGAGSEAEPFEIYTAEELNLIGLFMYEWDKHFTLMADIDMSGIVGRGFNIIGLYSNRPFTGVFDGDGHTISNFTYDSNGLNYIGLFGHIDDPNAEIKNLGLIEPDVNAGDGSAVGALVGDIYKGSVTACYVEGGIVSGDSSVGGLVGANGLGYVQGCYSTCGVTGEFRVGGLAGGNRGSVSNSYSMGSVIGDERVGGLVGEHYRGSITNSYSAGPVTGLTDTGGLIGFDYQNIAFSDSLWDVNSSGQTTSAGGIGRSTEQMQSLTTFVEYGWGGCGNGGEWTIDDGNDYPRLAWEGKAGTVISGELIDLLEGAGTPEEPYLIYNASQLNMVGAYSCEWSACFKLMADIDLSEYTGRSFNIIGSNPSWPVYGTAFTGVFDGNGHTISNFTYEINDIEEICCIGLFGYIEDPNAEVKNLGLIDPNIHISTEYRSWDIGSLAGYLDEGTIRDCYVEGGYVRGGSCGGLVGGSGSYCEISNCHFEGTVTGTGHAGGLTGGGSGRGISISNCYSAGSVTGEDRVGGLVGGFYPAAYISISDCYSTSNVTGRDYVGGLIGKNYRVNISNSYATGSVTGVDWVGGLAGSNSDGDITNCYSAGSVSGTWGVGGLVGGGNPDDVTDSYWDVNTSGQIDSYGGEGKTTEQMQDVATFTVWICDESEVWTIDDGNDYPRLAWENKPGGLLKDVLYGGGNGTESEPYLIYTAKQLNTIGLVECNWDKHFKLMSDIDLSEFTGDSFNIIGTRDYDEHGIPYTGIFDGDGHTISNFTYDSNEVFGSTGLFGGLGSAGCVKNLGLRDISVHGTYYTVGGLVGSLSGSIMNCYVEGGSVTGGSSVGGLVGFSRGGNILQCYSRCEVTGDNSVGGLAGYSEYYSIISSCYSKSNVTGSGAVGGLLGYNREGGIISNCYSAGRVVGDDDVGGFVGYHYNFYGDYTACFWDSDVNPDVNGIGNADEPNVVGLPTVLMQAESTFTDVGWDFVGEVINGPNDIWDICEGTNYPKLVWSIPAGDFICPDGVNMLDFAILGDAWMSEAGDLNWDPACDISEPNDNFIDELDLDVFTDNYLTGF